MSVPSCHRQLRTIIDEELALTTRLQAALRQEFDALTHMDPVALDEAADIKRGSIAALDQLECGRRHLCSALGFSPDHHGMSSLIAEDPDGSQLADAWNRLLEELRQCRDANHVNGAIVGTQRQRVNEALNLLRGGGENLSLYGPSGMTEASHRGVSLAEA